MTRRAKLDLDHGAREAEAPPKEPETPTRREGTSPLVKGAVLVGVGAVVGLGAWWIIRNKIDFLRKIL